MISPAFRHPDDLRPALRFLAGGGEATRLILARDWTAHPMGPPEAWPAAFKTALSLLLNSPESMILCWGSERLHFFFNEAYFPLLGPRLDRAMGAPFEEVWADAWAQARPIIDDAFAGRSQRFDNLPWKLDIDRGRADTWFTFSYSRVLDAHGAIAGLFIFTNETTERMLADRALAASQDELRALNATLEQQVADRTADRNRLWRMTSDLMLVATLEAVTEAVNPAWTEVLGWSEAELIGGSLFDLLHPDDVEPSRRAAAAIGEGQSLTRFENRWRHKDGSYRDIAWTAGPADGKLVAVGRDETAERAHAARLAQTEAQLRQAQKMEAVGQLTGGIAHDFNNMLTGVIGSLELLKRHLADGRSDRALRYIDAATTSAQRAAGLTHRLLAFSRRQSLDVQPVDVGQVVVGMEDLLRRTLGEQVGLEIRLATDIGLARTDANQLESALLNLAINARDAMPGGGLLTVETAPARLDPGDIDGFDVPDAGDYIALCVSDTGAGMPREVVAKAFDPFFTTKPIGQGTGLGLSMIYGFVRQTGGHVRIYSEVGQGTTVKLYLKRHEGEAAAVADRAGATAPGGQGEQVLVVEDEPAVRMLVVEVLEDLGYRVLEAADGRAALKLVETEATIDLLVTDVGLPGMNGRELATLVRDKVPGLKVLFVTGYAEGAAVRSGFLDPGMDMISKPFAIEALAAKIREMLGGP